MLKRQRPPSPISLPDEDVGPTDLYEPDNKRRRYFAPQRFTSQDKKDRFQVDDADSDDGDSGASGRKEYFNGKREWHVAAGVYKDANSLLHDLHAEQRHRALFNPNHLASSPTDMTHSIHPLHPLHARVTSYTSKDHASPLHDPFADFSERDTSSPYSLQMNYDGEGRNEQAEAEVVTQHYENSNRCVTYCIVI